jgi:hypothetical protein
MSLIEEYTNKCGCITKKYYEEIDKPFCTDKYWTIVVECITHKMDTDNKILLKQEQLKLKKEVWEEHKQEILKVKHINYVPIKCLKDKGLSYKASYLDREIKDLLLITKMRNRYYVSKEKLDLFDSTKMI